MRSFIIFGFLAVAANAGVLPGYQYGPGLSGVRQDVVYVGNQYGPGSIYNNAVGVLPNAPAFTDFVTSTGVSSGSDVITSGDFKQSGTTYNVGIDAVDSIPPAVHYSKQFYHFDAPEESHSDAIITRQLSNTLKKNLQVVFIKAPENTAATNAALQLAKQAIEQKTDIYVLSKQNDPAQLVGKLQQIQENVQTQPEVRFVKYRTPEDVLRAKASIQSQYDNFGGPSETYVGGVAPVLNYASPGKQPKIIFGGSSKPSASAYGFGTKFGSTYFVDSGSKFNSDLSLSSTQSSFLSASNSSESALPQLVDIANLDSAPNAEINTIITNTPYLPPTPFKK